MRRLVAASTALLLLVLGTQFVLAAYAPAGSLGLSASSVSPGSTVAVDGSGYAPSSEVRITIESTPVLLATVTADTSGAFHATVTVPSDFSGPHELIATGTDPQGSVRVLESPIQVGAGSPPPTDTSAGGAPVRSSDTLVLALAGVGIVILSAVIALVARRSATA